MSALSETRLPAELLAKLAAGRGLKRQEYAELIRGRELVDAERLFALARRERERVYGREVYLRGLIEISNHCKNDCLYCGIRRGNRAAVRYRLSRESILESCARGYALGLRTFVLQGGEDPRLDDAFICGTVAAIKKNWPDAAVTLSLGERERASYQSFREAGADRYLLRHETADAAHYGRLHPAGMSFEHRMRCLRDLKELGFQVGAGFMVGSPGQTPETLAADLDFLREFRPQMVGIGPFIPHHDTPFAREPQGSVDLTLFMLALVRLTLPGALLPATTALGTAASSAGLGGWERGMQAGANVIMPNLTPREERRHYLLYDGKTVTDAEESDEIAARMAKIGYEVTVSRGDAKSAAAS